ncbi:MAG: peptidylprolyl isomerase [Bacteroidota bacterium]
MKILYAAAVFIVLFIGSSCEKKTGEAITAQNLKEVLTRYGQENPENEVLIETGYGNIRLRLYDETPLHRANFVKLIKENHYEDAEFYRIFYQFMIQGGDLDNQFNYTVPAEFNTKYFHKKGALSMARSDENNPNLESSSTEFFIVHGARYADYQVDEDAKSFGLQLTPEQRQAYMTEGGYMSLDQKYTVFGEVVDGIEVVDKIASVKVYNEDKPLKKIPLKISVVSSGGKED